MLRSNPSRSIQIYKSAAWGAALSYSAVSEMRLPTRLCFSFGFSLSDAMVNIQDNVSALCGCNSLFLLVMPNRINEPQ